MAETLQIGTKFSSFADVDKAIEEYGQQTFTTFWKRDARTIASSKVVRPIESSLIYYQLVYACNHGGRKFKCTGNAIRKSWTFRKDCPVLVRFTASGDGKALQVTAICRNHNHDTSKVLHTNKLIKNSKRMVQQQLQKETLNLKASTSSLNIDGEVLGETPGFTTEIAAPKFQPMLMGSFIEKKKEALLLCTELADLATQHSDLLFEQRINVLRNLKSFWEKGFCVALTHTYDMEEEKPVIIKVEKSETA